ncbi:cyclin pho85 family protein [Schizosaccharomyces octosporus yFS286]|uniref:Cyclin pho85 family protein n=1 Tax=Schizosaccharomyces octosporus (strain yFS286) TaxID=483514 RepID=S9PY14_SCHOY|nr:cyclin pho85 family protein [Schizosaccharomyces octosporus yFS286]EPX72348.1 cyclin pho85 family protein [Schizosaccharomyces octosporus yFS286]
MFSVEKQSCPSPTFLQKKKTSSSMTLACTLLTSEQDLSSIKEHVDISSLNQDFLLEILSTFLLRLTRLNDKRQEGKDPNEIPFSATSLKNPSLVFSAKNIPSISIQSYLHRILKYCPATNDVFLSLIIYLDRVVRNFNFSFLINSYNIHRFLIAGFTAGSKFFSDVFYTNIRYSKVGGIPVQELNHLELSFFLFNDFNLFITLEDLQSYADLLVSWHSHHTSPSPVLSLTPAANQSLYSTTASSSPSSPYPNPPSQRNSTTHSPAPTFPSSPKPKDSNHPPSQNTPQQHQKQQSESSPIYSTSPRQPTVDHKLLSSNSLG